MNFHLHAVINELNLDVDKQVNAPVINQRLMHLTSSDVYIFKT